MDCHLSWASHINEVSKRFHYSLHSLKRLQNFLPHQTKILLAQSLLLPLIDYADVCYLDATEELLSKLERLQNLCIRFIFGLRKYDHVSDFRKKLQWLPIRQRRNAHVLNVLFNALQKSCPAYISDKFILTPCSERPVRSCITPKYFSVPQFNTIFYGKSFNVRAAKLWNDLPRTIQEIQTISKFKVKVKQHFLSVEC